MQYDNGIEPKLHTLPLAVSVRHKITEPHVKFRSATITVVGIGDMLMFFWRTCFDYDPKHLPLELNDTLMTVLLECIYKLNCLPLALRETSSSFSDSTRCSSCALCISVFLSVAISDSC